jgi:hypothetical protein
MVMVGAIVTLLLLGAMAYKLFFAQKNRAHLYEVKEVEGLSQHDVDAALKRSDSFAITIFSSKPAGDEMILGISPSQSVEEDDEEMVFYDNAFRGSRSLSNKTINSSMDLGNMMNKSAVLGSPSK